MIEDLESIEEAIQSCLRVRNSIATRSGFRTRTLLDMLLLELGKELARLTTLDEQDNPQQVKRDGRSIA